jgi:hypothetical protein
VVVADWQLVNHDHQTVKVVLVWTESTANPLLANSPMTTLKITGNLAA